MSRRPALPRVPDLRLLLPAMGGWTAAAATLAWPAQGRLALAGVLLAGALACLGASRRRNQRADPGTRRPSGGGRLGPLTGAAAWLGLSAGAAALTLLASGAQGMAREAGPVATLAAARAVVTVEGVVATEPVLRGGRTGQTAVLRLTVTEVTGRGTRSRVHTPLLVIGDEQWSGVRWRERVRVHGRLSAAETGEPVVALLRPRGAPEVVAAPGVVARGAEHLRAGLRRAAAPLPADARGLLPALVIGDTSRTPADLTEAMLATGMTHLSAVSGSNVAIVLAVALGAAALLGVRRRWRPVVAAPGARRVRGPGPAGAECHPGCRDGGRRPRRAEPVTARGRPARALGGRPRACSSSTRG